MLALKLGNRYAGALLRAGGGAGGRVDTIFSLARGAGS